MKQTQVHFFARNDLDLQRWHKAVRRASYGLSWWLDAVTKGNWLDIGLWDSKHR